jgi:hypothetical protein
MDTPLNYSGPAKLVTAEHEVDVELDLTVEAEPTSHGGSLRSWTADFTATGPFTLLAGQCKVLLPDGGRGNAFIRGWRAVPGKPYRGLLTGIGPSPTASEGRPPA